MCRHGSKDVTMNQVPQVYGGHGTIFFYNPSERLDAFSRIQTYHIRMSSFKMFNPREQPIQITTIPRNRSTSCISIL